MLRIFLVLVVFLSFYSLSAQERRSFQFWNMNSVQGNLSAKTSIRLAEKIHYTPRGRNLDVKSADMFLIRKPGNTFEYGAGFRLVYIDQELDWLKEQRYMLYGKILNDSEKFEYDFNNRLEYRNFDQPLNHIRHKQAFTLKFPEMTLLKLRIFATEETFIKFNRENFHMARFYAGIQTTSIKHLTMKFYYVQEKYLAINNWNTRDILGMNMSIEL